MTKFAKKTCAAISVSALILCAVPSYAKTPSSLSDLVGARAAGGPVNAGGAYLVGERGPEMFIPNSGGSIASAGMAPPVTININMPTGAGLNDAKRSSAQVSAALARAVYRGSGYL